MRFADRSDAGRQLAEALKDFRGRDDTVVLGLARGGVPVAYEVARALGVPLDVLVVRKLGAPGQEELAMGAIAAGGLRVLNEDVVRALGLEFPAIEHAVQRESVELERRERAYRSDRPPIALAGKRVILIDDGLATGSSMAVALRAVRRQNPAAIVVAVPTGPERTCEDLRDVADAVVCLDTPRPFFAVGQWYEDFHQTGDEEIIALLRDAHAGEHSREVGGRHA